MDTSPVSVVCDAVFLGCAKVVDEPVPLGRSGARGSKIVYDSLVTVL